MLSALLAGFLFGFIGSMPVAGPIAGLVLSRGLQGRFASGANIAVGAALAEAAYACLAFWGFSTLLADHGWIDPLPGRRLRLERSGGIVWEDGGCRDMLHNSNWVFATWQARGV